MIRWGKNAPRRSITPRLPRQPLLISLFLLISLPDSKGALGCLAPPRRPHPEGRTLVPLTLPFL